MRLFLDLNNNEVHCIVLVSDSIEFACSFLMDGSSLQNMPGQDLHHLHLRTLGRNLAILRLAIEHLAIRKLLKVLSEYDFKVICGLNYSGLRSDECQNF